MNIQRIWGNVLTATAHGVWRGWFKAHTESEFIWFISLPERCHLKRKSATIFDFFFFFFFFFWGGKGAKRSKDGDDGEACEWWRNLLNSASVGYCQAESVKYDTCFQKSSYLPWRLKFGHLGASGYQIYFSVYRVATSAFWNCEFS